MPEVPMPGGWMLSMAWMPMCGQTWGGAAAHFIGMWAVMMAAMMFPSLLPVLWRFAVALEQLGAARPLGLAALAGAAYLCVWTAIGALVFGAGAAFAQALMQVPTMARAVPVAGAMVVLLAGAFQFTAWKARHLACCRPGVWHELRVPSNAAMAWRYGVRLGLRCGRACAGLTAILLVIGVMDLCAMAFVAAAITAERLAPAGARVAWVVGALSVASGVYLLVRPVLPA